MSKIQFIGEVLAKNGYGVYTREFTRTILKDVKLVAKEDYIKPQDKYNSGFWVDELCKSMLKGDSKIRVHFCIPSLYDYNPDYFNIGMSLWNTDTYPKEWVVAMNRMSAVLFPSPGMLEAARFGGLRVPGAVFRPTLDCSRWDLEGEVYNISNVKENTIKFICEVGVSIDHSVEELISAFCIAFEGSKEACLVVKSSADTVENKRRVLGYVQSILSSMPGLNRPPVVILTDDMNEKQECELLRGMHYYVTIPKAVSMDVATVRAAACGLPNISLDLSNRPKGTERFRVKGSYTPVKNVNAHYYRFNQMWKIVDSKELCKNLVEAYALVKSKPDEYRKLKLSERERYIKMYQETDLIDVCENLQKVAEEMMNESKDRQAIQVPSMGMVR